MQRSGTDEQGGEQRRAEVPKVWMAGIWLTGAWRIWALHSGHSGMDVSRRRAVRSLLSRMESAEQKPDGPETNAPVRQPLCMTGKPAPQALAFP